MEDTKKAIGVKHAVVYIVILGAVCILLGVATGILIEKKCAARYPLPQIAKSHFVGHRAKRCFTEGRAGGLLQERMKERAERAFEKIRQDLGLSPEQGDKVKAILEGTRQQVRQARDEFRTKLEKARTESDTQILEILSPEQKEKFKELQARIGERGKFKEGKRWQCQRR